MMTMTKRMMSSSDVQKEADGGRNPPKPKEMKNMAIVELSCAECGCKELKLELAGSTERNVQKEADEGGGVPPQKKTIADEINYPDSWDTVAYPTLSSALSELSYWERAEKEAEGGGNPPKNPSKSRKR